MGLDLGLGPTCRGKNDIGYNYYLHWVQLLFILGTTIIYIFFSLISLIVDGPHHYRPACGHEGSSHLSPVHALRFFIAMQVQHSYNSPSNGYDYYLHWVRLLFRLGTTMIYDIIVGGGGAREQNSTKKLKCCTVFPSVRNDPDHY